MAFKKGDPKPKGSGRKKGVTNKPKPFMERLREAFGEHISDADMKDIVERALIHAKGDTIITESADGEKLTAKCVSDPRLFLGMGKMVADAEAKKPDFIAVPVSPEFYKSTIDKLDAIETDLNA